MVVLWRGEFELDSEREARIGELVFWRLRSKGN